MGAKKRIQQPTLFDTRADLSPAQKTMGRDKAREDRNINAAAILGAGPVSRALPAHASAAVDELMGGKRQGRVDNEVAALALEQIHKFLPDFSASMKDWESIQLAIEAGIRAGYDRGVGDSPAVHGG